MLSIKLEGLDEFEKKVNGLRKHNTVTEQAVKDFAERTRQEAINFTPLDTFRDIYPYPELKSHQTGDLIRHWQRPTTTRIGDNYESTIVNDAPYAAAVNYGHVAYPGQWIPPLGKKTVTNFVTGLFITDAVENMMTTTYGGYFSERYSHYLDEYFKE